MAAGALPGPRIVLGGYRFFPGGTNRTTGEEMQRLADEGSNRRALVLAQAYGVETAKMYRARTVPAGARFIREAHARGMRVTSHCAHALSLVAAGIDSKEDVGGNCDERTGGLYYEDMLLLFRQARIEVIPTVETRRLVFFPQMVEDPEVSTFLSPGMRWLVSQMPPQVAARFPRMGRTLREVTGRLHSAGVTIGVGTDVGVPGSLHWELEGMPRVSFRSTALRSCGAA